MEVKTNEDVVSEPKELTKPEPIAALPVEAKATVTTTVTPSTKVNLDYQPRMVNKFTSYLDYTFSPIDKRVFYKMKEEIHIKPFKNQKEFLANYAQLIRDVADKYDGVLIDIPWETSKPLEDGRVTTNAAIGFDINKFASNLNSDQFHQFYNKWRLLVNEAVDVSRDEEAKRTFEKVVAIAHPLEIKLSKQLERVTLSQLVEPIKFWNFFQNFDDEWYFQKPFPIERINPRTDFRWHDDHFSGLGEMLRKNIRFSKVMLDIVNGFLRDTVQTSVGSVPKIFEEFLKALQTNPAKFGNLNVLPAQLASAKADEMMRTLFTQYLMNEFQELQLVISFDRFDPALLLDCIIAHMTTLENMWSEDNVIRIDNYIAYYLLYKIIGVKTAIIPLDTDMLSTERNVNYLKRILQANNILPPQLRAAIAPFFMNWANGGVTSAILPFSQSTNGFVNPDRDCYCELITGQHISSYDETSTQLHNFVVCLSALSQATYLSDFDRNLNTAMKSLFLKYKENYSKFRYFGFNFQIIAKKLSLLSFVYPLRSIRKASEFPNRMIYQLGIADLSSLWLMADWEKTKLVRPLDDMCKWGWYLHWAISEMNTNWYYYKEIMPQEYYSKSMRLDAAFSGLRFNVPFLQEIKKHIHDNLADFEFASRDKLPQQFFDRLKLSTSFVNAFKNMLGWTDEFYMTNKYNIRKDAKFDRIFLADGSSSEEFDRTKLIQYLQSNTLFDRTQLAIENSTNVKFKLPVNLKLQEFIEYDFNAIPPIDFSFSVSDGLQYGTVTIYYRWTDRERVDGINKYVFNRPPQFCVKQVNFLDKEPDYVKSLVQLVEVYKKGQLNFIPIDFIERASRF